MASRSCGIIRLSWMIQTKTLCLDLSAFHFYTNILIEISACWFFTKFPGHVTHRLTLPPYWLNVTHLFVLDFTSSSSISWQYLVWNVSSMCLIQLSFYCQHWLKLMSLWSSKSFNGQENLLNTTQLAAVAVMLKIQWSRGQRENGLLFGRNLFSCLFVWWIWSSEVFQPTATEWCTSAV